MSSIDNQAEGVSQNLENIPLDKIECQLPTILLDVAEIVLHHKLFMFSCFGSSQDLEQFSEFWQFRLKSTTLQYGSLIGACISCHIVPKKSRQSEESLPAVLLQDCKRLRIHVIFRFDCCIQKLYFPDATSTT